MKTITITVDNNGGLTISQSEITLYETIGVLRSVEQKLISHLSQNVEEKPSIYGLPVVEITGFSRRTQNILKSINIKTVGDITKLKKREILKVKYAGKKVYTELRDYFELNNLKFADEK